MKKDYKNKSVLITAGPTREYLDAVRFLSNPSTGKMGYALAEAAAERGAKVTLVSGPVSLKAPKKVRVISVTTAAQMARVVFRYAPQSNIIIKTAAVSDYTPVHALKGKKKKAGPWTVDLKRTTDILQEIGEKKTKGQILVGFAAESEHLVSNAKSKLRKKNLDYIVANKIGETGEGFGTDVHEVILLDRRGRKKKLGKQTKRNLAHTLLNCITPKRCPPSAG